MLLRHLAARAGSSKLAAHWYSRTRDPVVLRLSLSGHTAQILAHHLARTQKTFAHVLRWPTAANGDWAQFRSCDAAWLLLQSSVRARIGIAYLEAPVDSSLRPVSLALQCVQEAILSAEPVPWATTASQDPYSEQACGEGSLPNPISLCVPVVLEG